MNIPKTCKAVIFDKPGAPLRVESVPLIPPPPGYVLARVRMTTICGSDLHTFMGRRTEPAPLVLGHEILGEVAALGDGISESADGRPLAEGKRITFSIAASCWECANCRNGLPQKCAALFKYGHSAFADHPGLSGGLAEYVYLRPGTSIYHVPETLSDKVACPVNCALATVVHGLQTIAVCAKDRVLVQGVGLLGLYAVARLAEMGVVEAVAADTDAGRLKLARRFGAHRTINISGMTDGEIVSAAGKGSFDCVVETSGNPAAVWPGMQTLGLKGRYLIIGLVSAGSTFSVDGNTITRNHLTIKGIHNYAPRHLAQGLQFLERTVSRFPYEELVTDIIPLADAHIAFDLTAQKRGIRVAVSGG